MRTTRRSLLLTLALLTIPLVIPSQAHAFDWRAALAVLSGKKTDPRATVSPGERMSFVQVTHNRNSGWKGYKPRGFTTYGFQEPGHKHVTTTVQYGGQPEKPKTGFWIRLGTRAQRR
jgi:hypothetical protein